MQTALALALLAAAAASALARPPEPTPAHVASLNSARPLGPLRQRASIPEAREYLLPRFLLPHYLGYDDSPRMPPPQRTLPQHHWLNKEIDRINQMEEEEEPVRPYDDDLAHWIARDPYLQHIFENSVRSDDRRPPLLDPLNYSPEKIRPPHHSQPNPGIPMLQITEVNKRLQVPKSKIGDKKTFALTPSERGYFEPELKTKSHQMMPEGIYINDGPIAAMVIEPPRQTRQNPNLSRTKTLVTENIDRLRSGLNSHEQGPGEKGREHIHVLEAGDSVDPLFFAAVGGAIAAAVSLTIFGFTFAWYTLAKKAKAAADVDYPAYGVTGPNLDSSGDRKLAHSAHMYHYQHQKQQIIAMESRMDLEQRLGSVSDPESEEENEEGDYTVYECPGFATTGDMEVKNPLFSEQPTPATPAHCELVKPQPKN